MKKSFIACSIVGFVIIFMVGCQSASQLERSAVKTTLHVNANWEDTYEILNQHAQQNWTGLNLFNPIIVKSTKHPPTTTAEIRQSQLNVTGEFVFVLLKIKKDGTDTCSIEIREGYGLFKRKTFYADIICNWLDEEHLAYTKESMTS